MGRNRQVLAGLRGKVISKVRRVFYVYENVADFSAGPVELSFSDGEVVFLEAGGDGQRLRVYESPWKDSFAGELSLENQEYVASHGKQTAFDVSNESDYLGREIEGVKIVDISVPGLFGDAAIIGVVLTMRGKSVRILVDADEITLEVC